MFLARTELGFTVDEWRALPWWQRRLYVEGLNARNREQAQQHGTQGDGGPAHGNRSSSFLDALYPGGDLTRIAAAGYSTN